MTLKERRKLLKFTQKQVAEKVGISRALYAHYETGVVKVQIGKPLRIAKVLGTSIEELFGSGNTTPTPIPCTNPHCENGIIHDQVRTRGGFNDDEVLPPAHCEHCHGEAKEPCAGGHAHCTGIATTYDEGEAVCEACAKDAEATR